MPDDSCRYRIPVIKIKRYTVEELFQKELWFLLPFHIFVHESEFKKMETDDEKLKALETEYGDITTRLEQVCTDGKLTEYEHQLILAMSDNVMRKITEKYQNINRRMEKLMGGQVLDYEAKRILNKGINIGREEGSKETKQIFKLHISGKSDEEIAEMCHVSIETVEKTLN